MCACRFWRKCSFDLIELLSQVFQLLRRRFGDLSLDLVTGYLQFPGFLLKKFMDDFFLSLYPGLYRREDVLFCLARYRYIPSLGVSKNSRDGVIISGSNGVEFVVVTARAGRCESKESPRKCINPVCEGFCFCLRLGFRISTVRGIGWSYRKKAGRQSVPFTKKISRNLVFYKLIVWEVRVEGIHYPVAVAPRVGKGLAVLRSAHSVTVASHVEPMSTPAFPVKRRLKQSVNYTGEGVGVRIFDECVDLLRGRG